MENNKHHDMLGCKTIQNSKDCLNIILDFYFQLIDASHSYQTIHELESSCSISMQMMFSRGCSFVQMLDGFSFYGSKKVLNCIIDPSVLFSLLRDIYEAVCSFEFVYILPNSQEKQMMAYNMYVISGLKERQNFNIKSKDGKYTLLAELKELNELIDDIKILPYFQTLPQCVQQNIITRINSPHPAYRLLYNDESIEPIKWENAYQYLGMKEKLFEDMYNYLCLNAHPTVISLRQFKDSFSKDNPHFIKASCIASKMVAGLLSIYAVDFCKKFEWAKGIYNRQSELTQWLIDANNIQSRSMDYALNAKWTTKTEYCFFE